MQFRHTNCDGVVKIYECLSNDIHNAEYLAIVVVEDQKEVWAIESYRDSDGVPQISSTGLQNLFEYYVEVFGIKPFIYVCKVMWAKR